MGKTRNEDIISHGGKPVSRMTAEEKAQAGLDRLSETTKNVIEDLKNRAHAPTTAKDEK